MNDTETKDLRQILAYMYNIGTSWYTELVEVKERCKELELENTKQKNDIIKLLKEQDTLIKCIDTNVKDVSDKSLPGLKNDIQKEVANIINSQFNCHLRPSITSIKQEIKENNSKIEQIIKEHVTNSKEDKGNGSVNISEEISKIQEQLERISQQIKNISSTNNGNTSSTPEFSDSGMTPSRED